jgi:hypothetical protein
MRLWVPFPSLQEKERAAEKYSLQYFTPESEWGTKIVEYLGT